MKHTFDFKPKTILLALGGLLLVASHTAYADSFSWGYNLYNQLGNATNLSNNSPSLISNGSKFIMIDGSSYNSIALKSDGSVWTWGYFYQGTLGDGITTTSNVPIAVALNNVVAVTAGASFAMALKTDGSVWSWGANQFFQLGNGSNVDSPVPVQSSVSNVIAISAEFSQAMALKDDGTVWAWGSNVYGQAGTDASIIQTPTQILDDTDRPITHITMISAGRYHSALLKSDGTVWLTGRTGSTTVNRATQVVGLSGIKEIDAGYEYTLALKNDGTVWAWGVNWFGNLGDGTTTERLTPVQVTEANGQNLSKVTRISAFTQSMAVKDDGSVWTWGYGGYGQLGHGTSMTQSFAQKVVALSGVNVNAVAAGDDHSFAYVAAMSEIHFQDLDEDNDDEHDHTDDPDD